MTDSLVQAGWDPWQRGLVLVSGNLLPKRRWRKHKPLIDSLSSTHRSSTSSCPGLTAPPLVPQHLAVPRNLPPSPQNRPPSWSLSPRSLATWPTFCTGLQAQKKKRTYWPPPAPRTPPTAWGVLRRPAMSWGATWRPSLLPETIGAGPRPMAGICFEHSYWDPTWRQGSPGTSRTWRMAHTCCPSPFFGLGRPGCKCGWSTPVRPLGFCEESGGRKEPLSILEGISAAPRGMKRLWFAMSTLCPLEQEGPPASTEMWIRVNSGSVLSPLPCPATL